MNADRDEFIGHRWGTDEQMDTDGRDDVVCHAEVLRSISMLTKAGRDPSPSTAQMTVSQLCESDFDELIEPCPICALIFSASLRLSGEKELS